VGYIFVDKTLFIKEIIDTGSEVLLFTRPRRFGKTINLSMLFHYFNHSKNDTSGLFKNLNIWDCGENYRQHQGKYPVLFISLKNLKFKSYKKLKLAFASLIAELCEKHRYLLTSNMLSNLQQKLFSQLLSCTTSKVDLTKSLAQLTLFLHLHHNEPVYLLIDEYDTPVHAAFGSEDFIRVMDFMRLFLGSALKGNPALKKGVLTGILRIAKESIFSDLNNLDVYSMLSPIYANYFGFTENEVIKLFNHPEIFPSFSDSNCSLSEIQKWYDGYRTWLAQSG